MPRVKVYANLFLTSFRDIRESARTIVLLEQENPWGAHVTNGFWLKSMRLYRIAYQNPGSAPHGFSCPKRPLII
ncbi:MAG: hypothetical protein LBT14_12845 [Treponema sp.]|nr:hypothetical protein [Treponema sp.]